MSMRILLGGIAMTLLLAIGPVLAQQQPGIVYDDGEPHAAPGSDVLAQERTEEKQLQKEDADSDFDPKDEEGPGSVVKRDRTEAENSGTEGEGTD